MCSCVFCEISTVTQERQEKLRGKERSGKTQEVVSYSWIHPLLMERSLMGDISPWCWVTSATREDQAAEAWAAGKCIIASNCISTCGKGELCSLLSSGMVGTSLWQRVVTMAVGVAAPTALLLPPLATIVAEGTHVALQASLPFFPRAALEIPHPSLCSHVQGNIFSWKRHIWCATLCYLVLINKAKMELFDSSCNFDYCNGVPFLWMQYASVPH